MSYQSKKSLYYIVLTTIVLVIYSIVFYSRYQNGLYQNMSIERFWSIFILLLIPISILTTILSEIVLGIALGVRKEFKKSNDRVVDVVDERDRFIELKVSKVSKYFFSVGFILAMIATYFELSLHYFFVIVIVFGYLSEIFEHLFNIYYREKGIR